MATTTRAVLRQRLSEWRGQLITGTTSSGGTTTTAIAATIVNYDAGLLANRWLLLTSGNNSGEARRISSVSSTTITVKSAFTNTVATSVTFEIHAHDPALLHNAINRATEHLYAVGVHKSIIDESLNIDDWLANSNYESTISGGAHPSWTNEGAGLTVTAETTIKRHGAQSAKLVEAGTSAARIHQSVTVNTNKLTEKSGWFVRWVYATAASTARIGVSFDGGSTYTYHDYHSGVDQWELQELHFDIPATATGIRVACEVATSGTGYFDGPGGLLIGRRDRYTVPTTFAGWPAQFSVQRSKLRPEETPVPLQSAWWPSGHYLQMVGQGLLSTLSADSGTIEVGQPQVNLIIAQAARYLYGSLLGAEPDREPLWRGFMADAEREVQALLATPGVRKPPLGAHDPQGVYRLVEDANGRYVELWGNR